MSDDLIRITAPNFVAGYDRRSGMIAPIIKYMRGWTDEQISAYCKGKGWTCAKLKGAKNEAAIKMLVIA